MKESRLVVLLAIVFLVLSVPLLIDAQASMAKKHVGPVPFPPDIIPVIHEKNDKNHKEITLKSK